MPANVVGEGVLEVTAELSRDSNGKLRDAMGRFASEGGKAGDDAGEQFGGRFLSAVNRIGIGTALGTLFSKAMGAISSSIGDAVSRVDTLNNFPLVMQNLGFSAEEASASVDTMSKRLQGLPTALDTMTSATQRLASSPLVGSLTEATDIALAMNNALLAGGGPISVTTAAMEQYSQAVSRGTFELEEWRSLTTAMPGQLQQLATSMLGAGASSMDLYNALKTGEITMQEFNAALVDLDKNGTAGFASFSQQALIAQGGIQTAFTNMKTAITRGLANIIDPLAPLITGALGLITQGINGISGALSSGLASLDLAGIIQRGLESGISPASIGLNIVSAISEGIVTNAPLLAQGMTTMITGLVDSIQAALPRVVQAFTVLINAMVVALPTILPAVVQGFVAMVQGISVAILGALPGLVTAITSVIPMIATTLLAAIPQLLAAGLQLFQSLIQAAVLVLPQIVSALVAMLPQLGQAIITALPLIIQAALDLFLGVVQGLVQAVPIIIQAVLDLLPVLIQTLLGMLPTIIDAALELFLGVVTAVITAIPQIITAVLTMLPQLTATLLGMIPQLLQAAIRLFTGIIDALPKIIPQLISALIGLAPVMVNALIQIIPSLIKAGGDLIKGLVDGLIKAGASVGRALLKIAQDAVGNFLAFLGIKSPSRLMSDYGQNIGEGLALGILDERAAVDAAMGALVPDVRSIPVSASPLGAGAAGLGYAGAGAVGVGNQVSATFNLSGPDPRRLAIETYNELAQLVG